MPHFDLLKERVDAVLFEFLERIYQYERQLESLLGVNYQQIYLLQVLRRNPDRHIGELAQDLKIPLFQATRLVNRLVEMGFVAKRRETDDRRGVLVWLLPAGEAVIARVEERSYQVVLNNAQHLSEEEMYGFWTAANNIQKILEPPDETLDR